MGNNAVSQTKTTSPPACIYPLLDDLSSDPTSTLPPWGRDLIPSCAAASCSNPTNPPISSTLQRGGRLHLRLEWSLFTSLCSSLLPYRRQAHTLPSLPCSVKSQHRLVTLLGLAQLLAEHRGHGSLVHRTGRLCTCSTLSPAGAGVANGGATTSQQSWRLCSKSTAAPSKGGRGGISYVGGLHALTHRTLPRPHHIHHCGPGDPNHARQYSRDLLLGDA